MWKNSDYIPKLPLDLTLYAVLDGNSTPFYDPLRCRSDYTREFAARSVSDRPHLRKSSDIELATHRDSGGRSSFASQFLVGWREPL